MQGHVHEAGQPLRIDLGHPGHRRGVEHPVAHEAQPSRPLRHQQPAVGQERQPPGMLEPPGHHHHANLRLLGGGEDPRLVGQRHRRQAGKLGGGVHRYRQGAPARQDNPYRQGHAPTASLHSHRHLHHESIAASSMRPM